jgi:arylsulfatase A-like enzyme/Tfp pilus assembly protein PilF
VRRPNVLLITIDTLRADRIGAGVAPAIDRLAASGVRFTAARTAVPLTLPSHTTIHTGLLPPAHGVRENGAVLADAHMTIARALKGAGYETAAFIGAFVLDRRFGLAQGFDTYDDQIPRDPNATERLEAERPAWAVVDRAIAWLTPRLATSPQQPPPSRQPPADPDSRPSRGSGRPEHVEGRIPSPWFVWLHLYDPHAPYSPPPEFRARAKTAYDGEIAYADAQVQRLLDALRASGQLDRVLVVVAGDHGEGLGDHGERTHGMLLYDSTLRVPLVIAGAGLAAATRDDAVSLTDVAPTILRAAGLAPPDAMKGRDLLGRMGGMSGTDSTGGPDLYAETEYPRVAGWAPLQALTDGRWKTIRAGAAAEVYDVANDPREEHDIAAAQTSVAAAMAARAAAIHASAAAASGSHVSAEAQERLRALGYVATSAQAAPASGAPNPASRIKTWNDFEEALTALSGHRPDALPALARLAAAQPDAPVIRTTYARALKEAGQVQAALAAYRDAAQRWPTDAALLHDLAVTARDAARIMPAAGAARAMRDEAARADQAALVLDPNSAMAHNGLGLLAIDADRLADAATSFERATTNDPNNASYWTNLGNARRALGDRAAAEQAYRKALEVDARAADAANGLGVLLVEANRAVEAAPYFERAIAAAPDLVEARLNLGIALQSAGQPARAAEQYRAVLAAPGGHAREKQAAAKLLAAAGGAR